MKMKVVEIRVEEYKSGPRDGQYRSFDLPDGAVVLRSHVSWPGLYKTLHLTLAVPV